MRHVVLLIFRYGIDELLRVYIILRTQYHDEVQLHPYLRRLAINLEVQAHGFQPKRSNVNDASREASASQAEDCLWSGRIDTSEDGTEVIRHGSREDMESYVLAIWCVTVPLSGWW